MGIFDVAKGIASMAMNEVSKSIETENEWTERYRRYSREELKREYEKKRFTSSAGRMRAFKNVCREKGLLKN